jgi:hypothetical protein
VFDYWAKIQSGITAGNLQNFGHFDECIRFRHRSNEIGTIQGQHCMIDYRATENKNETMWDDVFDWREM